jgi:ribosome-binding factor A
MTDTAAPQAGRPIREIVAEALGGSRIPGCFVTTDARVTNDLQHATVYRPGRRGDPRRPH